MDKYLSTDSIDFKKVFYKYWYGDKKLPSVKGFPEGLDLENLEINYIGKDSIQILAGGDWQEMIPFSFVVTSRDDKPLIVDLFYSAYQKTPAKEIRQYMDSVKDLSISPLKEDASWAKVDPIEYDEELISLVQIAYKNAPLGSFINTTKDMIQSDWKAADVDGDRELDATIFYREPKSTEPWKNLKIQGIGHDGSREAIVAVLSKLEDMLRTGEYWIEASDALEHILNKRQAPVLKDERYAQAVFPNTALKMISDNGQYTRTAGGKEISETIFGNPGLKAELLNEYVSHVPGHKNSKGEAAPWVIKDHKTNKILSSHSSRTDAKAHLQQMHVFGENAIFLNEKKTMQSLGYEELYSVPAVGMILQLQPNNKVGVYLRHRPIPFRHAQWLSHISLKKAFPNAEYIDDTEVKGVTIPEHYELPLDEAEKAIEWAREQENKLTQDKQRQMELIDMDLDDNAQMISLERDLGLREKIFQKDIRDVEYKGDAETKTEYLSQFREGFEDAVEYFSFWKADFKTPWKYKDFIIKPKKHTLGAFQTKYGRISIDSEITFELFYERRLIARLSNIASFSYDESRNIYDTTDSEWGVLFGEVRDEYDLTDPKKGNYIRPGSEFLVHEAFDQIAAENHASSINNSGKELQEGINLERAYRTIDGRHMDPGYMWHKVFTTEAGVVYNIFIDMQELHFTAEGSSKFALIEFTFQDPNDESHSHAHIAIGIDTMYKIFATVASEIFKCYEENPGVVIWIFSADKNEGEHEEGKDSSRQKAYRTMANQLAKKLDWFYIDDNKSSTGENYYVISPEVPDADIEKVLHILSDNETIAEELFIQIMSERDSSEALAEGMSKNYDNSFPRQNAHETFDTESGDLALASEFSYDTDYKSALKISRRMSKLKDRRPDLAEKGFFESIDEFLEDFGGVNMSGGFSAMAPDHMLGKPITLNVPGGKGVSSAERGIDMNPWDSAYKNVSK